MNTRQKLSFATISATWLALGTVTTAQAGTLGGQLFATGGDIQVQILGGTAGITSYLSIYSPERIGIATNREVGRIVNIKGFPIGQELIFGISADGNTFLLGPGSRNPDGIPHGQVSFLSPGVAQVGFEDLFGGGDWDFDDNNFIFSGGIAPTPPVAPTITSITSDLTIPINALFDFAVTATDPDWGDILTYMWDFNNDGLYDDFIGSSGQWSFSQPGIHPIGVRISDRYNLVTDASFKVEAVPEPSSVLGLLAFGAFSAGSLVKRFWEQKDKDSRDN